MEPSANSNMFTFAQDEIFACFSPFLEGLETASMIIISQEGLSETAKEALRKTFATRGYGENACLFVTATSFLQGNEDMPLQLDAESLFVLIEGIDPHMVIATDRHAASLASQAYRVPFPYNQFTSLFGRMAIAFSDFQQLLKDQEGKQHAWNLLKKVPPCNE